MDISLLRTFLEVARTRHFGKAADRLCITQSAVSARIKLLEDVLGVPVFSRKRNNIQLTTAGHRLHRHAETIVFGWERASQEIALDNDYRQVTTIGFVFDLWGVFVSDWAASLTEAEGGQSLRLEAHAGDALLHKLQSGLLDIVLMFEPPKLDGLEIILVDSISLNLYSDRQGCLAEEHLGSGYIHVDWGPVFERSYAKSYRHAGVPAMRAGMGMFAKDLLSSIGGSAYLPEKLVENEISSGKLFLVEDALTFERPVHAVWKEDDERTDQYRQMVQTINI